VHPEAYYFFLSSLRTLPKRGAVVEIGARNVNGSLRQLFIENPPPVYVGVDIAPGPLVDVVADGAEYTPLFAPDTVLSAEVLEHTSQAEAICRNAYQMLAPGGVFIVSAAADPRAQHSAVDGGGLREGEYYRNVNPQELREWLSLSGFHIHSVQHDTNRGDVYAVAWKPKWLSSRCDTGADVPGGGAA